MALFTKTVCFPWEFSAKYSALENGDGDEETLKGSHSRSVSSASSGPREGGWLVTAEAGRGRVPLKLHI